MHVDLTDFDALSFDCYGTLIDWESGILAVLAPWAKAAGLALSGDQLLAVYAAHEARIEAGHGQWLYPAVLAETFAAVGRELEVAVPAGSMAELARSVPRWPPFPDSSGALAELGTRYKLVIVSNVDRQSFAGSSAALGVSFDAVITAQDVGSYKPAAANFEALLAGVGDLGVAPGRLLHVAQSLFHDHVPAKAFGLSTVWINRRAGRPGWGATPRPQGGVAPDWEFASMADFAAAAQR